MGRITSLAWYEWVYLCAFWAGVVYVYIRLQAAWDVTALADIRGTVPDNDIWFVWLAQLTRRVSSTVSTAMSVGMGILVVVVLYNGATKSPEPWDDDDNDSPDGGNTRPSSQMSKAEAKRAKIKAKRALRKQQKRAHKR